MPKRFWRGKKRLAKKYLGNKIFNKLFRHGIPKVGDLTHDCDGFNHIIERVDVVYDYPESIGLAYNNMINRWWYSSSEGEKKLIARIEKNSKRRIKGVIIPMVECFYPSRYTDKNSGEIRPYEHIVCGCQGICWQIPLERKDIESWALRWTEMKESQIVGGWGWDPQCDTWADIINSGGHIADERGLLIE